MPIRRCLFLFAAALLAAACSDATATGFTPARTFPDTTSKTMVFADQLPTLSTAQAQFAASHMVGTQKQLSSQIDGIRQYNPNFLMIQYRLGTMDDGDQVNFIHNNAWSSDWATINPNETWFVHDSRGQRVYQDYSSVKQWIMDISGNANGNTTNGWKQFWATATQADIAASHGDGVFADSSSLPWAVNSQFYTNGVTWRGGSAPYTALSPDITSFYQYQYNAYTQANLYFIPNIGSLTTTIDTNTAYYTYVHGAMEEGFAVKSSDWLMQQQRTLQLVSGTNPDGSHKVWIAENYISSASDIATRVWYLSNYLLMKNDRSYINITGVGSEMHWWPEYSLDMGSPRTLIPSSMSALAVGNGLYRRYYDKGMVLVNPTGSTINYTFDINDPRYLMTPVGGGDILSNGQWAPANAGYLTYLAENGATLSLAPYSATILTTTIPEPASLCLLSVLTAALLLRRRGNGDAPARLEDPALVLCFWEADADFLKHAAGMTNNSN